MGAVLGLDVGGTKTLAAVATIDGQIAGVGRGPAGNQQVVGMDGFRRAVDEATDAALAAAGATRQDIAAVHIGAAGADLPADFVGLRAALGDSYGDAGLENDSLLGIAAGTTAGWGGVVVGGSGTNAAAVAPDGRTLFVGGIGWHAGDWGGASFLGVEGLRLAIRSWEGREPGSVLPDLIVALMGVADMAAVFEKVATWAGPDPLAVAPLVVRAARDGDAPATDLLRRFGAEMGCSVGTALRRLGIAADHPETVAVGGLVRMAEGTVLLDALLDELREHAPGASLVALDVEPVVGAAVTALRRAGADAPGLAARLREQWRAYERTAAGPAS